MVEGGTGGLQPVLEHLHVLGVAVLFVEVTHGIHGETHVPRVFQRGKGTGGGKLGGVRGAVDEMTAANHHIVPAAKERLGML